MTNLSYPDRIYLLSDTYGGQQTWNPYESPDIDAHIATDIRSRFPDVRRSFDTFGAKAISDHVLRTIVALHDAVSGLGSTGVFINSAPRTEKGSNGEPFYVADTDNGIRVVATPLSALSAIKDRIAGLKHLPNEDNGLYTEREQFRSSLTAVLLAGNHGLDLIEDSPSDIPEYPAGCRVSYADRFGNLVLFEKNDQETGSIRDTIASGIGRVINLNIGSVERELVIGESLGEAKPGSLVIYPNDGNIEVVSKWGPDWSAQDSLKRSAYEQFEKPSIGTIAAI
ncbi:MAG: hypothetical protein ABII07_06275 [Patescibacteria group bacterium]|nr:hypothetical protein [Patescibacteria group bacterium]